MTSSQPVVSEEERKKKSVYYESCTSAFKDDLPVLVTCLRSDKNDPHTRQEAGFLLWHHALAGNDLPGLLNAGILPACIANLDSPTSALLPAERACSAGILLSLATGSEDVSEQLLRVRAPSGRPSLEVLHAHLREDAAMARQYCCRLLHLLAKQVPHVMLKAMDNQLPYLPAYLGVWGVPEQRDAPVVTAVGFMVALLVQARPELAEELVAAGAVTALLDVLRNHKSEAACCAVLTLLLRLLAVEAAARQVISQGGIPLLIDVVGPPPRLAPPPPPPAEDPEPLSPAPPASPPSRTSLDSGQGDGDRPSDSAAGPSPRGAPGEEAVLRRSGYSVSSRGAAGAVATGGTPADSEAAGAAGPRAGGTGRSSKGPESPKESEAGASSPTNPAARRHNAAGPSGAASLQGMGTSSSSVGSAMRAVQLPLAIPGIHTPHDVPSASTPGRTVAASGLGAEASTASLGGLSFAASASAASLVTMYGNGRATGNGTADAGFSGGDTALLPPPAPPPADLETNRCGLRWIMLPGLEVASLAVAGLTVLVQQRPECLAETERRLVSHRIIAQLKATMAAAAAAAGAAKKTRKKGLGLTAEQTAGLTRALGLLKFLSLMNATRYRIAKLGAVPALVRLYREGSDYLLRNHCQAILSNVALLAENGQALKDGKTPEEFLVANPLRLSAKERTALRLEFPDDLPVLVA